MAPAPRDDHHGWLGWRRVEYVTVRGGRTRPRYEAVGVAHRLPRRRAVPARVARALVASGVPLVNRSARREGRSW